MKLDNLEVESKNKRATTLRCSICDGVTIVKNSHFDKGMFCCNVCNHLGNSELMYDYRHAMIEKSQVKKICQFCRISDSLSNMLSIRGKQLKKEKDKIWNFHEDCMHENNYNLEEIQEIILRSAVNESNLFKRGFNDVGVKINERTTNNAVKVATIRDVLPVINKSYYSISDIRELCCIYSIMNTDNGHKYVGSTINLQTRLRKHMSDLTQKNHPSFHLQSAFNKMNNDIRLVAYVLKVFPYPVNNETLHKFEQDYIDSNNSCNMGYNIHPVAGYGGSYTKYLTELNNRLEIKEAYKDEYK